MAGFITPNHIPLKIFVRNRHNAVLTQAVKSDALSRGMVMSPGIRIPPCKALSSLDFHPSLQRLTLEGIKMNLRYNKHR